MKLMQHKTRGTIYLIIARDDLLLTLAHKIYNAPLYFMVPTGKVFPLTNLTDAIICSNIFEEST